MRVEPRGWAFRVTAVAVLIVAYFMLWNPLRALVAQHVAAPAIESVTGVASEPGPHPAVVHFAGESRRFIAPAGLSFLIGAVVLLVAAPRPRYLGSFLAAHLLLGVFSAIGLTAYLSGSAWGGILHDFVMRYLVDAVTLAAMVLAVTILWRPPPRTAPAAEPPTPGGP